MRLENGMKFDNCVGLQDRAADSGVVFDANGFECHDRPLSSGESIDVSGRTYRYVGDDNLGNSIFTALEPWPEFEIVEMHYKENLFIALEVYLMKNGKFYVWPYVQTGATSSDTRVRQYFRFHGEFETREAAIEAGWAAGKERIDTLYLPLY
jgi:hypothetical protein